MHKKIFQNYLGGGECEKKNGEKKRKHENTKRKSNKKKNEEEKKRKKEKVKRIGGKKKIERKKSILPIDLQLKFIFILFSPSNPHPHMPTASELNDFL